ncbi:MAG TPA: hypothetical protein VD973_18785 [Symbiobacteriaceae bacterium]|nr:hypothetical protein [Symbiobacteriaceae bacterium]
MPERKLRPGAPWTVTAVPAGTLPEAELAAARARRLVAGWLFTGIVGTAEAETEARQTCP